MREQGKPDNKLIEFCPGVIHVAFLFLPMGWR